MSKIVVVGGGVSGIVSAICAASDKNNEVIVLESMDSPLKKLLITGNGKCNFFNDDFDISHYHSKNIDFFKEIINLDNKNKVLSFYDRIGIVSRIKNGLYYPSSNQAITIKNALLKEAFIMGVNILLHSYVKKIEKNNDKFLVYFNDEVISCDKVVISTGSCAYPKTGSDGSGYNLALSLGHCISNVLPALVQLYGEGTYFKDLSGVRTDCKVSLYENDYFIKSEVGELQFTNYGISGICVFNLSGFISLGLSQNKREVIYINFVNHLNINSSEQLIKFIEERNSYTKDRTICELIDGILNYKLTNVILKKSSINGDKLFDELSFEEKNKLAKNIVSFNIDIINTNSFDSCQVCQGGVSLDQVNPLTFESNIIDNLYFTGEVLDIYGDCGGYNLGFAVLSGLIVGNLLGGLDD